MKTFGDLFIYLDSNIGKRAEHFDMSLVEEFVDKDFLMNVKRILISHGGYDDVEVIVNCEDEVEWDRLLDSKLSRGEWAQVAEDELGDKCWYCGKKTNLWDVSDELWAESGLDGYVCPVCFLQRMDFKRGEANKLVELPDNPRYPCVKRYTISPVNPTQKHKRLGHRDAVTGRRCNK